MTIAEAFMCIPEECKAKESEAIKYLKWTLRWFIHEERMNGKECKENARRRRVTQVVEEFRVSEEDM